jgi:tetratricopeptide (TPR) repeat protein
LLQIFDDPKGAQQSFQTALQTDNSLQAQVTTLRRGLSLAEIEQDPSYRQLIIGRSLGSLGYWDLAARSFKKAIDITPDYPEAWAFLGEANQHLEMEGYSYLQKGLELNPNSTIVNALLALYWRRQGLPENALTNLLHAAEVEPAQAVWQIEIGNTLADMGETSLALVHFQKAIELESSNPSYWIILAQFSLAKNMDIRGIALPAARQAVILSPNEPVALDLLGWTMVSLEDLQEGERFTLRALQENPDYAPANLHLAQIYLQIGKSAQAYPYLRKALDLSTEQPEVQQMALRLMRQYFEGG